MGQIDMRFVVKKYGKEVVLGPLKSAVDLSVIPDDFKFSGVNDAFVDGHKGSGLMIFGIEDLVIISSKSGEIWRSALAATMCEGSGISRVKVTCGEKEINVGIGFTTKKRLISHFLEAQKFANDPEKVQQAKDNPPDPPLPSKKEIEEQRRQIEEKKYGNVVVTANVSALRSVSLHSKGYVSGICPTPEKLLAISGEANVVRKSALGRGLGAAISLPLSGFTISNLDSNELRGDVYITIVTEVKTHSIHIDLAKQPAGVNPVGEMQKLVTAGEALLSTLQKSTPHGEPEIRRQSDLAGQLSQLNQLFESGVLSQTEFEVAKKKIING